MHLYQHEEHREAEIYASEHFPDSNGRVTGGARMNARQAVLEYKDLSLPSRGETNTFVHWSYPASVNQSSLSYNASGAVQTQCEGGEEKQNNRWGAQVWQHETPLNACALWYSQDQRGVTWTRVTELWPQIGNVPPKDSTATGSGWVRCEDQCWKPESSGAAGAHHKQALEEALFPHNLLPPIPHL